MKKEKRIYSEAQLSVVKLSGSSTLLAGSETGGSPSLHTLNFGAQRQNYTMGSAFQ